MTPDVPKSPVQAAHDAKASRDLSAELGALTDGYATLTEAPWFPPVEGDIITVHYEAAGQARAFQEQYLVTRPEDREHIALTFTGCAPDSAQIRSMCGFYAGDDFGDPVGDLWMEAGPHRLTITRCGETIHDGPAGVPGSDR